MKWSLLTILLILFSHDINKIAKINRLKKEAEKAYAAKNYKEAAGIYQTLADSLGQNDEALLMNLSHCYFQLRDTGNAITEYKKLTQSGDPSIRSTAYQQLGVLDAQSNRYADAEEDFRNSLRSNPGNDQARYDYELLKKKLRNQQQNQPNQPKDQNKDQNKQNQEKQNQQQDQQKQDQKNNQQNQDQQKQEQNQQQREDQKKQQDKNKDKKQEAQQAEQQNENQDKNKDKRQLLKNDKQEVQKISIDKARMILEAMKNSEEQYLQQLQHKATKKPDSDKPDW